MLPKDKRQRNKHQPQSFVCLRCFFYGFDPMGFTIKLTKNHLGIIRCFNFLHPPFPYANPKGFQGITSKPCFFSGPFALQVMLRQVARSSPTREGITPLGAVKRKPIRVAKMGWDAGTGWWFHFFFHPKFLGK